MSFSIHAAIGKNEKSYHYASLPSSPRCSESSRDAEVQRDKSTYKPCRYIIFLTIGNLVLFLLTLVLSLYAYNTKAVPTDDILNAELRATSSYSPIFDRLDLEPSIRRINGTVLATEHPGIARQFPNEEADAQWEDDIDLIRPIAVTREQIIMMGKDPETVAKLEDKDWGLGDNAYVAALDVFHNLHCLNTLRRAAYGAYYNATADANNRHGEFEIHLNHCTDILFQHISCSNNVNLVTRHWRLDQDYPFPDFSINKYCINYEKLHVWHKEAGLDMDNYIKTMKRPKGAKISTEAT